MKTQGNWPELTKYGLLAAMGIAVVYGLLLKMEFIQTFKAFFFMLAGMYFILAVVNNKEIYTGGPIISPNDHFVFRAVFFCLGVVLFFGGIYQIFVG